MRFKEHPTSLERKLILNPPKTNINMNIYTGIDGSEFVRM